MKRNQTGFTLIEIAIVLVIIGLLLGGVLKGQEMINSAKVKNLANDFKNTPALLYGYQDKFKAIPGDDSAAIAHISGVVATTPAGTVGNGVINGAWNSNVTTDESYLFWQHVSLAGLSTGGTTAPTNAQGGIFGVTGGTAPITNLPGSFFVCAGSIPGKLMAQLDTTLDDGNPTTGSMRAAKGTAALAATWTPVAADNYVAGADDSALYTVCQGS